MNKLFSNMTFWVMTLALAGYGSAMLFGDKSWVDLPMGSADSPWFYDLLVTIKDMYIKLLRVLVAPVVFISIIAGLLNIRSVTQLRRMGSRTLSYYLLTTAIAIGLGLIAVFYVHPWEGGATIGDSGMAAFASASSTSSVSYIDPQGGSLMVVLNQLLSKAFVNPITALAELNIIGIVFNAFAFGLAMMLVVPKDSPLLTMVEDLNRVIHKLLSWVIKLTPIGVFAIIFDFSLRMGGAIVDQLLWFCLVVFAVTMIHALLVLPAIGYFFGGLTPWQLLRKTAYPMMVAFSTASSSATLPVTMKVCEDDLKVSRPVASFVLPLGATMNMDGTALFEGIAAVFLAYLFGIELSNTAIVVVFLMAMVSSVGAPGMPSGSMSGMQMVLLAVGIPLEAIAILLVVERPLDTFRTAVNVEGDMVGALVVQRALDKQDSLAGSNA